jgi:hypothetical protein
VHPCLAGFSLLTDRQKFGGKIAAAYVFGQRNCNRGLHVFQEIVIKIRFCHATSPIFKIRMITLHESPDWRVRSTHEKSGQRLSLAAFSVVPPAFGGKISYRKYP